MLKNKQHIEDVKRIMGFDEEMIGILPKIDSGEVLNPWARELPKVISQMGLKKGMVILDLACGRGGVSVPLAQKYHVKVIGYDIIPEYVQRAAQLAQKNRVEKLCRFYVGDIREVVKRKNICDVLLWIAPPHLWKDSHETIQALRNCVKNNGLIIVGDAYLYSRAGREHYENYDILEDMHRDFTSFGDEIIKFIDYGGRFWKEDYARERKHYLQLLKKSSDNKERKVIWRKIKMHIAEEKKDSRYLGLGIWVVRINKK